MKIDSIAVAAVSRRRRHPVPFAAMIIQTRARVREGVLTRRRGHVISNFDNEMQKSTKAGETQRDQDLYGGLIRLHILHHASKGPVFGLWFIEELGRHGYKLSPGTLYPLLHGLERKGYLHSINERSGKSLRRMYQATPKGRKALSTAKQKVSDLFGELFENE